MLADLKMPGAREAVDGVLAKVDSGAVTAGEAIEQVLGAQIALRNTRRLQAAMRASRLPAVKTLAQFDFTFQPRSKREQIESLHELGCLDRRENGILLGPPGVGKTHLDVPASGAAQRRPERQPRLHLFHARHEPSDEVRSTKAGASTPATRGRPRRRTDHPGHRSTKAGASTPATLLHARSMHRKPNALNEGRSVNPGYTRKLPHDRRGARLVAQRRPERQPRLHHGENIRQAFADAQRRPERQPRLHPPRRPERQPRAQRRPERQPRRHSPRLEVTLRAAPLNEGRSVNPGDTSRARAPLGRTRSPLNEGRSVNPGDTGANIKYMDRLLNSAQRRPERQPRRHN